MDILAQVLGFIGLALAITSFQSKTRKGILFFQTLCGFTFTLHFLMLSAYTGAVLNVLSATRGIVFYNKEKRWASSPVWLYIFVLLFIITGAVTWEGYVTMLPVLACLIFTVTLYMDNPSTVRKFAWIGSPCWIVYNIFNKSYGGIITEILAMVSIFTAIYRYDIKPSLIKDENPL